MPEPHHHSRRTRPIPTRRHGQTAATLLALAMIVTSAPARAQTYDPAYPVCLQSYSMGGGSINCSYTSMAQCQATASGRSAECLDNPYFTRAAAPAGQAQRRRRARY